MLRFLLDFCLIKSQTFKQMIRVVLLHQRMVFVFLFGLLFISVFWFGRLSIQLSELEMDTSKRALAIEPCRSKDSSSSLRTYLMVLIMTEPDNSAVRSVIRQTWLQLSRKTPQMYRYLFPIGTRNLSISQVEQLNNESASNNGDLVLLSGLIDSYKHLTLKTLLSISFSVESVDFQFLLKVDGDSFVRLGALLKSLRDIEHPNLYWGFLDGRARPFQQQGGKWQEEEWRLCDRYLPYQLGGGYVLSRSLAVFIHLNRDQLKLYRNEDVSIGAWLAGLKVRYVHDPRFDTEYRSRGCNNEYLITHKKKPAEMRQLFNNLAVHGALCYPSEYRIRPSYIYDFTRPPSECCTRRNGSRIP